MEKYIDLHTHSTFSDGTLTPTELITLAKKQNLSAIALTDHDTIDGLAEAFKTGEKLHMNVIAGIELAALYDKYEKTEIHIVGLGIDFQSFELKKQLKIIQNARTERNMQILQKLTNFGFSMTYEELKQTAGGEIITRAHYAKLMLEKGYIKERTEAFQKYISPGLPCYVERKFLTPKLCIETILKAGGKAVLAHPTLYYMNANQIEQLCKELITYGLNGIETMYSSYSFEQQMQIKKIADKLNLKYSGGSDFHGQNKPDIFLGVGKGNLKIPYTYLDNLQL